MKINRNEKILQEEEAYKNKFTPTQKPISSLELKRKLNWSIKHIKPNPGVNKTNLFDDSASQFKDNLNFLNELTQNANNKILDNINNINYNLNNVTNSNNNQKKFLKENGSSKIDLIYCLGILNSNSLKNSFCFNYTEKFFIYLSKNIIVIEDFSIEKNRTQKLLTDSIYELQGVKLSLNNKLLMCWTNLTLCKSNPFILFYQFENYFPKFTMINKLFFDKGNIIDCEFSPTSEYVVILSKHKNNVYFISLYDFVENKINITTFLKEEINTIEFNKYITNLEFCILGNQSLTLWRLNSFEHKLEYQPIKFNNTNKNDCYYTAINYFKTKFNINNNEMILLLVGFSDSKVICLDSKTNSEIFIFNNINITKSIKFIISNNDMLCFITDNKIKYCNNINNNSQICQNFEKYLNFLEFSEISFDSKIEAINYNKLNGFDVLLLTAKANLYYTNVFENLSIKIFSFLRGDNDILNMKIIKKKYENFLNNNENEINEDEIYYIITLHKNNEIKVWNIPEYKLIYNFETINEEIKCFDSALNEIFFVVGYNTNIIRFFNNEKFLGKFNTEKLGSYSYIIIIKILADVRYIYLIDEANTIYLIFVEQKDPLIIQFHKILKTEYIIKDFNTSYLDCYNNFYINLQNLYIYIYNKKYSVAISKNANNTPEFYVKDKIFLNECFIGNKNIENNIYVKFSMDNRNKNLIFIFSKRNKMILVRNFENHTNIKNINFQDDIQAFAITNNNDYLFFLYNDKIQKTSISNLIEENFEFTNTEDLCENEKELIESNNDNYKIILSHDCLYMVVYSKNSLFIYKI